MRRILLILMLLLGGAAPSWAEVDTGRVAGVQARSAVPRGRSFTIELKGAELKESLRFLARIAGYNVMIPEGISGAVNVTFESAPVLDAINSIVKANGLEYAIERDILRIGKAEQFTTSGEDLKAETIRLKFANAKQMTDKVKSLLTSRGSVIADERTNSIIVRETMANIEHVRRFLDNVDIRDAQVLIAAKLVEATRDWSRSLGIQWGINTNTSSGHNVTGVPTVGVSGGGRNLNVNVPAVNPTSGIGLLIGRVFGGTIDVAITAAEQKGDLHVISEPQIVTSNGVPAKIRSGETIYVKTAGSVSIGGSSAAGTGQTGLQSIETGVELNVTPQISVGGYVQMAINATSSSPDFTRQVDGIPAIIDNKASTSVFVRDGETTVIGGLMKWRQQDQRRRVPYVSEIPLLGNVFKSRTRQKLNTELMIFIRPTIVSNDYIASPMIYELPRVEEVKQDTTMRDQPHRKPERPARTTPHRVTKSPKSWERTNPPLPADSSDRW
ncbi:MAG: hypothetical protein HY543_11485 [Deltaproteobacteria bacterium]|nr:hypothetical protein [Deltaproteobacteria bacterium]